MKNILHFGKFECRRARAAMPALADNDLAAIDTVWLRSHIEGCVECRVAFESFQALDLELTGWGERTLASVPETLVARDEMERLLRMQPARTRPNRIIRWMPAAAAAVAAALLIAMFEPQAPPAASRTRTADASQFVEIPYMAPLDPRENVTVVRMNIRVATLLAMGFRIAADPDSTVIADVLVGEDGRAHAIRVLSSVDMSGAGD